MNVLEFVSTPLPARPTGRKREGGERVVRGIDWKEKAVMATDHPGQQQHQASEGEGSEGRSIVEDRKHLCLLQISYRGNRKT
jgi:hypothetical protein